jgi:hypothetical protein
VAALILIEMKSQDEFPFAVAGSVHRVSASFNPDNSPHVFQGLKEAYPNPISGWFLNWRLHPGSRGAD